MKRTVARLLVRIAKRLLAGERGVRDLIRPSWLADAYFRAHVLAELTELAAIAPDEDHGERRGRLLELAQELVAGLAGENVLGILDDCRRRAAAVRPTH